MAAGIVYHNFTTSSGVTFAVACWVPDTAAPDVGAIPVHLLVDSAGAPISPLSYGSAAAPASTILSVQGPQGDAAARLLSSAASVNATVVKNGAGRVRRFRGKNNRTTPVFIKFYNKASAPTVGTDTPILTIELAPLSYFDEPLDFYFATGIGYGLTSAIADNDTGAVASGDITGLNVLYQ